MISKDGWLYIGKEAYLFERDNFYKINNYSKERLTQVSAGARTGADLAKYTITRTSTATAKGRRAAEVNCLQEYWVGGNKRRMAGVIGSTNYQGFYSMVYCVAKHQSRLFGSIWSTSDTPVIRTSGTVNVVYESPSGGPGWSYQASFNEERANTGWAEVSFQSAYIQNATPPKTWNYDPLY